MRVERSIHWHQLWLEERAPGGDFTTRKLVARRCIDPDCPAGLTIHADDPDPERELQGGSRSSTNSRPEGDEIR